MSSDQPTMESLILEREEALKSPRQLTPEEARRLDAAYATFVRETKITLIWFREQLEQKRYGIGELSTKPRPYKADDTELVLNQRHVTQTFACLYKKKDDYLCAVRVYSDGEVYFRTFTPGSGAASPWQLINSRSQLDHITMSTKVIEEMRGSYTYADLYTDRR